LFCIERFGCDAGRNFKTSINLVNAAAFHLFAAVLSRLKQAGLLPSRFKVSVSQGLAFRNWTNFAELVRRSKVLSARDS
jgi:hypothetical protein